jgi:chromate transporter
MIYLKLFLTFFEIGMFTFGGGYAMISLIREKVLAFGWLSEEELLNMIAVSESSPGPIAVNMATFVGSTQGGLLGSLAATIGICIPSFLIIYAISLFFDTFLSLQLVEYAFRGIQVCVVYLIFSAGLKMLKKMKKTAFSVTVVSTVVLCMVTFSLFAVHLSSILYILICGGVGLFVHLLTTMKQKKEATK